MKNLFARIADRYDTMNRIMSLGLDCLWRRSALKYIELPEGCKILDLACGTGDFTIELARRWPNAEIIGVDLTPEMLDIAREKLSAIQNATYITGDAQSLPMLESKQFALIVCAFGFRNFPDKAKALSECHRLLADGGRLVVLELFRPTSRITGMLVNTWLAVVSRLFASDASTEYRYLRRSVANTVTAAEFIATAEDCGFSLCRNSFFPPAATCITFKKEQHS
jgi:demethylmenaquinone methyltransferase/2-methoxy-6-polyprenyl-1,4-benzoquinol methylase